MAKLKIEADGVNKVLSDAKEIQDQLEKIKKIAKGNKIEMSDKEALAVLKNLQKEADKTSKSLESIDKNVKFSNFKAAAKTISNELVSIAQDSLSFENSVSENISGVGNSIAAIASQFGIVGAAAGALITVVTPLIASFFELSAAEKSVENATNSYIETVSKESAELSKNINILKDSKATYDSKAAAITNLQNLFPGYFNNLNIENATIEELNRIYNIGNILIKERALSQSVNAEIAAKDAEITNAQLTFVKDLITFKKQLLSQGLSEIETEKILKQVRSGNFKDIKDSSGEQLSGVRNVRIAYENMTSAISDAKEAQDELNKVASDFGLTAEERKIADAERAKVDAERAKADAKAKEDRDKKATEDGEKGMKEDSDRRKKEVEDAKLANKKDNDDAEAKRKKDIAELDKIQKDYEDAFQAQKILIDAEIAAREALDKDVAESVQKSFEKIEASRKQDILDQREYLNALSQQTLFKYSQEDEALKKQLDGAIKSRKESGKEQDQNELDLISSITAQRLKILENSYNEELKILERAYNQKIIDNTATKADTVKFETDKLAAKVKYSKAAEEIEKESQEKTEKRQKLTNEKIIDGAVSLTKELQNLGNLVFDVVQQNSQNILDGLEEDLSLVESKSSDVISKIAELEGALEGERSGRRDAILQSLEQQRELEEQLAKDKIALALRIEKENVKIRKREQAAAIVNAVINGALAITSILAQPSLIPEPANSIYKAIQIGISAATTATQIALIASQKFAKGGFTGNGGNIDETGHRVAGVVHNDEWVAPKWLVESPKFGGVINELENVRQKGFANGGFTTPNYQNVSNALSVDKSSQIISAKLDNFINMSMALANRPIVANPIEFSNVESTVARRMNASTIGG